MRQTRIQGTDLTVRGGLGGEERLDPGYEVDGLMYFATSKLDPITFHRLHAQSPSTVHILTILFVHLA